MADKTQFLNGKPTLTELTKYVRLGSDWHLFGTQLGLDSADLNGINLLQNENIHHRTMKMFQLWLDRNPYPTRQKILDTLRLEVIGLNRIAKDYEDALRNGSIRK